MVTVGQIVFSKCGHDKGKPFVVFMLDDEYVYLVDGDLRKIEKPKKKKLRHIQKTNKIALELKNNIELNNLIKDSDIRMAISEQLYNN